MGGVKAAYGNLTAAVAAAEPAFSDDDVDSARNLQRATTELTTALQQLGVALIPVLDLLATGTGQIATIVQGIATRRDTGWPTT